MDVRVSIAALRLQRPVVTAGGTHDERTSVFLEVRDDGRVGVAELPVAAIAGHDVTAPEVLAALEARLGDEVAGPLATRGQRAAQHLFDAAQLDLALRGRERSLASILGVRARSVGFAGVVGVASPGDAARQAGALVAGGATRVRVKLAPGQGLEALRAVLAAVHVPVVADANGAFDERSAAELDELADLPIAWLEEPCAASAPAVWAALAARGVRLGADESLDALAALDRIEAEGVVQVVCVKPARLGLDDAREALARAERLGLARYVGGYFEAGLARAVAGVLSAFAADLDGDVVAPSTYLEHDPCHLAAPEHGRQPLHHAPGLGPVPDPDALRMVHEIHGLPRERLAMPS